MFKSFCLGTSKGKREPEQGGLRMILKVCPSNPWDNLTLPTPVRLLAVPTSLDLPHSGCTGREFFLNDERDIEELGECPARCCGIFALLMAMNLRA
jgi:hypothetical protein